MTRSTTVLLATALFVAALPVRASRIDATSVDRLATLGRVWVAVKFAHPRVALTDRDWDAVLDRALPAVRAATTAAAFDEAVGAMLATIGDPETRVMRAANARESTPPGTPPVPPVMRALPDGAWLIDVRAPGALADVPTMRNAITGNLDAIRRADRLVVDSRGTAVSGSNGSQILGMLNDLLVGAPTPLPAARYVRHSGYRPQLGGAAFYTSDLVTESAAVQKPRAGMGPRRVAFVIDANAHVLPLALSLQAKGLGAVVSVGPAPEMPARTIELPLGDEAVAVIRVADTVVDGRRVEVTADETLGPIGDAEVYARATARLAASPDRKAGLDDPAPIWLPENDYASEPLPTEAHRLLAVYRLWGVFDAFFPYKALMDRPWDDALRDFIPLALAADTPLAYAQVMAKMAARTSDSHVGVNGSAALTQYFGAVTPPVLVRFIEHKPVVTRVLQPQAAPGLLAGDEIVTIDGKNVAARIAEIEPYIAYSTPAGRDRVVSGRLLAGAPSSASHLMVRSANGPAHEVVVSRGPASPVTSQRDGETVRLLDGGIGYADLERLGVAGVPAMFDRFKDTIGIIFDMRGYPLGTAWAIAPRIHTRKGSVAALFERPMLTAGDNSERLSFSQDLPPTTTAVYDKPTVMLIDERAISQAEHTGLFFKAANGTTFIGTGTTGANGDVTTTVLPGGLRVSFTGHDVRWPDGHQLQRVGLVPDIVVAPTIVGVRAGRDEVLERAVEFLKKGR